jgi:hypothetical protein
VAVPSYEVDDLLRVKAALDRRTDDHRLCAQHDLVRNLGFRVAQVDLMSGAAKTICDSFADLRGLSEVTSVDHQDSHARSKCKKQPALLPVRIAGARYDLVAFDSRLISIANGG